MTRRCTQALVALALATAAGCTFYTDSINGEPDAFIFIDTPGPYYAKRPIRLTADTSHDPNDPAEALTAKWTVYACDDALGSSCPTRLDTEELSVFAPYVFENPERRTYRVTLEVSDERGATDLDDVVIPIANQDPMLTVDPQGCDGCGGYVLGTWIDFLADASDPDDDPVELTWELFEPDASTDAQFAAVTGYPVPAYRLVPDVAGLWQVRVTATDGAGGERVYDESFEVKADAAPCIAQIEPAVPGATYVIAADDPPRRFAALAVTDDLDPFPAPLDPGPFRGQATFRWYVASPDTGGALTELSGHEAADYLLDPTGFAAGDRLSIRVEVDDRVGRTLSCPAGDATCSIEDDGCLQRVTWEVEIR